MVGGIFRVSSRAHRTSLPAQFYPSSDDDSDVNVDGGEDDARRVRQRLQPAAESDDDYIPPSVFNQQLETGATRPMSVRTRRSAHREAPGEAPVLQAPGEAPVLQAPVLYLPGEAPVLRVPVLRGSVLRVPVSQVPEEVADLLGRAQQLLNAKKATDDEQVKQLTEQLHSVQQRLCEKERDSAEDMKRVELLEVELSEAHACISRVTASEQSMGIEKDALDMCPYPGCQVSSVQWISQHPTSWRTDFGVCKHGHRTCTNHIEVSILERLTTLEVDPCANTTCIDCSCEEPFTQIELEHVLPLEARQLFEAEKLAVVHRQVKSKQLATEELQEQLDVAKRCIICFEEDNGQYVCFPCGHRMACKGCVARVRVESTVCYTCKVPHNSQFVEVFF